MDRFLKVAGESVWINLNRVDGLIVRPQLSTTAPISGDLLEERHEVTGNYEVAVYFHHHLTPVRVFPSRAEAEAFVQELLGELEV